LNIDRSALEKAAKENIISAEQVEPLYQFIQTQSSPEMIDENPIPLKFVRSFGDIFVSLGIILLVIAINMSNITGPMHLIPVVIYIGLAEWLVRGRRLVLPGIAILISILYFTNKAVPLENENTALLASSMISLISLLFYLRYKMPFSLLPLALGLVGLSISSIGLGILENPMLFVLFGFIIFIAAFWFDAKDTQRVSHLSDNAFWLYLIASPLIIHGVMITLITSDAVWIKSVNIEILMISFFILFFLIALLIDRRVMLISTQLYMIYALTQLIQNNSSNIESAIMYSLIGLSLVVIYFGTYWYKSRRILFGFIRNTPIAQFIPDLNTSDVID